MEDKVISILKKLDTNNLIGINDVSIECKRKYISLTFSNLVRISAVKFSDTCIEFKVLQLDRYLFNDNIGNCIKILSFIKDNISNLKKELISLLSNF